MRGILHKNLGEKRGLGKSCWGLSTGYRTIVLDSTMDIGTQNPRYGIFATQPCFALKDVQYIPRCHVGSDYYEVCSNMFVLIEHHVFRTLFPWLNVKNRYEFRYKTI